MTTIIILLSVLVGSSAVYLVSMIWRNFMAKHKLFKKSPNIPLAPGANLIFGHTALFAIQKHNTLTMHEYHKKLGTNYALINQQTATISTTDVELVKNINEDHFDRPKIVSSLEMMSQDSIIGAHGQKWLRIRRSIAPALSAHKIKSPQVQAETRKILDKLIELIKIKINSRSVDAAGAVNFAEINLNVFIARFTLDFVFTNFFKQPNLITYTEKKDYWIYQLLALGIPSLANPALIFLEKFPILHPINNWFVMNLKSKSIFHKAIRSFTIDAAKSYVEARRKAETQNKHDPDFDFTKANQIQLKDGSKFERKPVDYILDRLYDGSLTFNQYVSSVSFLHFAAERTLCDVIIDVIHNLSLHPEVQNKLRNSLAVEDSEYMKWVIKETIRLHPPVTQSRTLRRDAYTDDGNLIPNGTHVFPSVYSIHRLKKYWGEDADEFRPERWVDEKSFHPAQFLAFSLGKRTCPGKAMAYNLIATVIKTLIMEFKFEKSNKSQASCKFTAPLHVFTIMDSPPYVKVSLLKTDNNHGNNCISAVH